MTERGRGRPLLLVPGIQGRWEWMGPAVDALARRFRVVTYSLLDEGRSDTARGFDAQVEQVDEVLGLASIDRAIVCGVSYGGLIAVRYAAQRPARVDRLVLVSTPAPGWRPDERVRRYASAPRSSALAFVCGAPRRLYREISAAIPRPLTRAAVAAGYVASIVRNPASPRCMAARVRWVTGQDFVTDAKRVAAPTLVVTGDESLDRVVPVRGTLEYVDLIEGAVAARLEHTGHIGLVTRPEAFAELIARWSTNGDPPHPRPVRRPRNAR